MPFSELSTLSEFNHTAYNIEYDSIKGKKLRPGVIPVSKNSQVKQGINNKYVKYDGNKKYSFGNLFRDKELILSEIKNSSTKIATQNYQNMWPKIILSSFGSDVLTEAISFPLVKPELWARHKGEYPLGFFLLLEGLVKNYFAPHISPIGGNGSVKSCEKNSLIRIQNITPNLFGGFNADIKYYVDAQIDNCMKVTPRSGLTATLCGTFENIPRNLRINGNENPKLIENIKFKPGKIIFDEYFYYKFIKQMLYYNPLNINIKGVTMHMEVMDILKDMLRYTDGVKKKCYLAIDATLKSSTCVTPFLLGYCLQSMMYLAIFSWKKNGGIPEIYKYIQQNAERIANLFNGLSSLKNRREAYSELAFPNDGLDIANNILASQNMDYFKFAKCFLFEHLKKEGLFNDNDSFVIPPINKIDKESPLFPKYEIQPPVCDDIFFSKPLELQLSRPIEEVLLDSKIPAIFCQNIHLFLGR